VFASINRSQWLVLGFFALVATSLVLILAVDPSIYARTLGSQAGLAAPIEIAFLVAVLALISVLSLGVARRWRWTFWVIVLAFLAGVLRVPASALEIAGVLHATEPLWYIVFQGAIGIVQVGIGLLLLRGHHRAGVWGAF
jgi:hypothetical protein